MNEALVNMTCVWCRLQPSHPLLASFLYHSHGLHCVADESLSCLGHLRRTESHAIVLRVSTVLLPLYFGTVRNETAC